MWSFILSDIIGDPMDLIASGPTVPSPKNPEEAISIIEKYGLQENLAIVYSLLKAMCEKSSVNYVAQKVKVINKVVGSNVLAINTAADAAHKFGFETVVLGKSLLGEAKQLGIAFARLSHHVFADTVGSNDLESIVVENFQNHGLNLSDLKAVCSEIYSAMQTSSRLCIISGGESTVTLTVEHGVGGRNQEMVLSYALELDYLQKSSISNRNTSVTFLSGGTDGQDGPTSAAGAVFSSADLETFDKSWAKQCLDQHDSNSYFQKSNNLIVTGLTGTNVMDIQILLIEKTL